MDVVSRETRSQIMSRVKQRDSRIELVLRSALWHAGLRYHKHVRMRGIPDLVLRRPKILIFVDSCFWHGCRFHCRRPKTHVKFWQAKIARNRARDLKVNRFYRRRGWMVLRFWEHQLNTNLEGCVDRVLAAVARSMDLQSMPRHVRDSIPNGGRESRW
jgi:DNA mismatch endonuclease (patch repair protein)